MPPLSGSSGGGPRAHRCGELIRPLAVIGVATVVVAGPMLSFALAHPNDWNARVNQIGIIQSGWFARASELTGKGTAQLLADQFLRSAGAFHVFADRAPWYGADRPLLGFLAGICALLGMAWAAAHWRERRWFLVQIWFWGVILTGGMLTDSPPSSQRLVMAIPAVCLLVAAGLEADGGPGPAAARADPAVEKLALGLLIVALAASNLHYYFVDLHSIPPLWRLKRRDGDGDRRTTCAASRPEPRSTCWGRRASIGSSGQWVFWRHRWRGMTSSRRPPARLPCPTRARRRCSSCWPSVPKS